MLQVTIVTCVILVLGADHTLSKKSSSKTDDVNNESGHRLTREVDEFLMPQDSRGFGYNIEGEGQQSSHFRKEQRDLNGVVRGSYGLKDPNGSFRLVRYIADDKGFRAHVASNERGVGRQSPANVRINLFSGTEYDSKDTNAPETLFSTSTQQDVKYIPENQDMLSNYNFYTPVNSRPNDESQRKLGPFDQRKQLLSNRFIDHMSRITETQPTGDSRSFPWPNHSYSLQNQGVNDGNGYFDKRDPSSNPSRWEYDGMTGYDDYNSPSRVSPGSATNIRNFDDGSPYLENDNLNFKNTPGFKTYDDTNVRVPPNILKLMLYQPQQKVHTTLPDCDSVSSAVLCKPPLIYTTNYLQYNSTEKRFNPPNERSGDNAFRRYTKEERRERIEAILAERLYRFAASNDETFPSRTLSNTFPQHENMNRAFSNLKHFSQTDAQCNHKQKSDSRGLSDLAVTNSLNRPVIYNSISNTHISSLMKYGGNWNEPLQNSDRPSYGLVNDQQMIQRGLSSQSGGITPFSNHDKFILVSSKNEKILPDNSIFNLFKNMNVLGFIILPKDKSIEESEKRSDYESPKESTTTSSVTPNNVINSDLKHNIKGIQEELTSDSRAYTKAPKPSVPSDDPVPEAISKHMDPNFSIGELPNSEESDDALDDHLDSMLQLNNSQFLILDDTNSHRNEDNQQSSDETSKIGPKSHPLNWRKILEDEIKEDYEKTSVTNPSNYTKELEMHSNTSRNGGIPNERIYNIHEPQIPLYDSRGIPIKSENVPLHLHRYVQPTGVTSFPWKFAIPRPAPPRSLVIPPKPSALS